jgi:hypothetical protein
VPPSVWHRAAQDVRERAMSRADLQIIEDNSMGGNLKQI